MKELKKFGKAIMIGGFIMFASGITDMFENGEYLLWFGIILSSLGIVLTGTAIYKSNQ